MPWATIYDIRNGSDLSFNIGLALSTGCLTVLSLVCAVASLRRPSGTAGRRTVFGVLCVTSALFALVALLGVAGIRGSQKLREDLAAGRFTQVQGEVTAVKMAEFTRHADPMFRVGARWFFFPGSGQAGCAPRQGDRARVAFVPDEDLHFADDIMRIETNRGCARR